MTTREQIESFYRFALAELDRGQAEPSIEDLFDSWQCRGLSDAEFSESVAAVQAALRDMENGDTGRPLEDVIAEIRAGSREPRKP